jgi:ribonuclease D
MSGEFYLSEEPEPIFYVLYRFLLMSQTPLIASDEALNPLLHTWSTRPWLALDTEFVRVDTYYPKLCLVQVGDGQHSVCIDTLALRDLTPLLDLLKRPDLLKVFHAASQDLEILVQLGGSCPAPLFDTQLAATLLGLGDQIGYAALVEKQLGIVLDKSLTRTDWSRRPLTAPELAYAAADVEHLAVLYPMLRDALAQAGRLAWLEEDCARAANGSHYITEPADAWRRLKGLARLNPQAQTAAAALAAWREQRAQSHNRPRKWIIEDDAIYRMAERLPRNLAELGALTILPPRTLARHGESLLAALDAARAAPAVALTHDERLRAIATTHDIPASLLAPRADLEALVLQGAQAGIPLLEGWRREIAGRELLELL